MKLPYLALALHLGCATTSLAQTTAPASTYDFEYANGRLPATWYTNDGKGYRVTLDSAVRHQGKYALRMQDSQAKEGQFGVATLRIPAQYAGKSVTLKGFIKTEGVSEQGSAAIWLREDGPNGSVAFKNTQDQRTRGTSDWKQFSITLPLDEQAEYILFGGILAGTGTAWFDDLELTIDGKPLPAVATRTAAIKPAAQDTAFLSGSGITFPDKLTQQQVENLAVLGRVWGFVKYYHPAVAAGNFNMDVELFRVLPSVLVAPNEKTRSQLLSAWVTKFGAVPACKSCKELPADKVRLQPDLAWLTDEKQLGKELRTQLAYLRQNRNQGAHYYINTAPNVGNPVFQHETAYERVETPDAGLRLLALYRFWNMVDYFFPYRYAIGEDWQQVLPEFIPKLTSSSTAEQYRLTLQALIARIHDSHAGIQNDKVLNEYKGNLYAPVRLRFVENQAVVTDYYNAALGKESGLQLGDVVVKIDGVPVPELIKKWQPIAPASNESAQLRDIAKLLLRGHTEKVPIVVRRDGKEFPVTITRYEGAKLNLKMDWGTPDTEASAWRLLPGNIGYLALGTIKKSKLPEIMRAAKETKGLIIDIRNYPAEFVVAPLSQYLVRKSTPFAFFSGPDVTYPGRFPIAQPEYVRSGIGQFYPGKVVVLVNEISQSQAEYTTMALRTAPNATVIGSTTAGADGNVSTIILPGGISTWITGLGVYYPDGRETQRVGIVPDIEVKPTIQGIKEGRDELLERAVQLIETAG
ncbi:S41 family peptidase [Hymenobacter aerilatus]|uniref:S41 family peptidase n=1 Tax=Hymenobacter aerilatus TaxID=2932251 RepID=A0A8T9SR25_9BACT|nr:S41 family peptidase [Hymenobacter aerilatus]UOR04598.1 S41 family peptidase [Hymenobacter aerilatus]